jgi:GntR family transcriptional regulator, transcriptional repressor for pyruvate dehydrogenase complex
MADDTIGQGLVAREDASQEVARRIQQRVVEQGLQPGDRIGREEDLAAAFGVSRPTLREALRILSSAHLVRSAKGPGGGLFVAASPEDSLALKVSELIGSMIRTESIRIEELLETRILLEVPMAGLAARRAGPADVEDLYGLIDELEAASQDQLQFGLVDVEIHRAIARLAGNRVASSLAAWIADILLPAVRDRIAPALVELVIVAQQRDLVDAIARGDASAAEEAMRAHLLYTIDLSSAVTDGTCAPDSAVVSDAGRLTSGGRA